VIAASLAASWLVSRLGVRAVAVLGFALQAAGLLLLVRVLTEGSFATDVQPAFVLVGLGAPIAFVPTTSAALAGDSDTSGLAAGIFNTSQQIGNAPASTTDMRTVSGTEKDLAPVALQPCRKSSGERRTDDRRVTPRRCAATRRQSTRGGDCAGAAFFRIYRSVLSLAFSRRSRFSSAHSSAVSQ
jgi:hypothetical protein